MVQSADLCFASGDFLFLYHTECGLLTSYHSGFILYSTMSVALQETSGIKLVVLLQKDEIWEAQLPVMVEL